MSGTNIMKIKLIFITLCFMFYGWFFLQGVEQYMPDPEIDHITIDLNPVSLYPVDHDLDDMVALALNVYHEARGEGTKGMYAVAFVTLNRFWDNRWPDSIHSVVYERRFLSNKCQFSWVCILGDYEPKNNVLWDKAFYIAMDVLMNDGYIDDPSKGSQYYHASYVQPDWTVTLTKSVTINQHHFYRDI